MSSASLLSLPADLQALIVRRLPLAALPRIARTCRALAQRVAHEDHWRHRLRELDVLEMCETHRAKEVFVKADKSVDWRMYFASYTALLAVGRQHELKIVKTDAEAKPTLRPKDRMQKQFPAPMCADHSSLVYCSVGTPLFDSWEARRHKEGREEGLFYVTGDPNPWHYFNASRYIPFNRNLGLKCSETHLALPDLRAAKSALLLLSHDMAIFGCGITWREYQWHLLDALWHAAQCKPHEESQWPLLDRHYRSALAMLHPVTITVMLKMEVQKIRVCADPSKLIERINARFGLPRKTGNTVSATADVTNVVLSGAAMVKLYEAGEAWKYKEGQVWKVLLPRTP